MKCRSREERSVDLQVLIHHIYEYKKGIRNMVLHTMSKQEQSDAEFLLQQKGISYFIDSVNSKKINIFFGNPNCVEVIRSFGNKMLSEYTAEEDFILGIMLGYDRNKQCDRYLNRKEKVFTLEKVKTSA